jgi:hypothetical protein
VPESPVKIAVLLPAVVVAVTAVVMGLKLHARRRAAAKVRLSGGRKSLVMNLFDRA